MTDSLEPHPKPPLLRAPDCHDAEAIWRLVGQTGVLDENSCYLYLLLCRDFAGTCMVAERDSKIIGFVTAYRPPERPGVLFVWQVAVSPDHQRQGLAGRLLSALYRRQPSNTVQFVEATVAPSNHSSRRLFAALAKELQAPMSEHDGFLESHFPVHQDFHEAEPVIRIGPLTEDRLTEQLPTEPLMTEDAWRSRSRATTSSEN